MRFSKMFIAVGVSATVIIVAVAVFSVFRVATTIPAEQVVAGSRNANGQARPNASEVQAGAASTAVEQNVKPIDTKVGSVAGVDLSGLASDANQTAATSAPLPPEADGCPTAANRPWWPSASARSHR